MCFISQVITWERSGRARSDPEINYVGAVEPKGSEQPGDKLRGSGNKKAFKSRRGVSSLIA